MSLLWRTKLMENDGTDPTSTQPKMVVSRTCYIPCVVLCVSLNDRSVRFSQSRSSENFDSYGLASYKREIMAYLLCRSISWTFKRHKLQGLTQTNWGYYCWFYDLQRAKGLCIKSFMNMLLHASYTCVDLWTVCTFCARVGVSCMQPVRAAAATAVLQVADIKALALTIITY